MSWLKTDKKKTGTKSKAEKPSAAPAKAAEGLPMFFTKPRALGHTRHAEASVESGSHYGFARKTNSIPINAIEFIEASKHYPIIFTASVHPMPAVVAGLEHTNYFVGSDDAWKSETYVPAYVRQYPFIFLEEPAEKKLYLCIDEGSGAFSSAPKKGYLPLYTSEGKPDTVTQNALQFCTAYYNHYLITRNFCADLKHYNLLMPYHSEARLASGKTLNLSGFQMIDEKAFAQLPEQTFLEFRDKGWLAFIYLALGAASNWKRLVDLEGQRPQKRTKAAS